MTDIYEEVAVAIRKTQIDRVAVTLPMKDDYIAMAKATVDLVLERLVGDIALDNAVEAFYENMSTTEGYLRSHIEAALKAAAEAIRGGEE